MSKAARWIPVAAAFAATVLAAAAPASPRLQHSGDASTRSTGAFDSANARPLPFLNTGGFKELSTYNESRSRSHGLTPMRTGLTADDPTGLETLHRVRMHEARRLSREPGLARMASGRVLQFATPPPIPLAV